MLAGRHGAAGCAVSAGHNAGAQNTEAHRQHQNGEKGYGRVSERKIQRLMGLRLQTVGPLETPSAPAMAQSLRILERMGALNSQHDIVMDYKARLPACSQGSAGFAGCVPRSIPCMLATWLLLKSASLASRQPCQAV